MNILDAFKNVRWKCRMSNDAVFEIVTTSLVKSVEARKLLLEHSKYYEPRDIVRIWRVKG